MSNSTTEKGSEKESDIEESGAKSDAESVVSGQEHVENQQVTLPLNLDSDSDIREIKYDIEQKGHNDQLGLDIAVLKTGTETVKEGQSDLLEGRVMRKATHPQKPFTPKRKNAPNTYIGPPLKVKFPFPKNTVNEEKEIIIKCSRSDNNDISERETMITEDGENIFKNSVSRKRQKQDDLMVINVDDVVPAGKVDTSNIQLSLSTGGQVELKFKYNPSDV